MKQGSLASGPPLQDASAFETIFKARMVSRWNELGGARLYLGDYFQRLHVKTFKIALVLRASELVGGDTPVIIAWPLDAGCGGTGVDTVAIGG